MQEYLSSKGCTIKRREGRGRCVEAVETLRAGTLVSRSLVDNYCLHPKYWSTKCYYCLKQIKYAGGLRTDTNWPPVRFCNKVCLDKDAHYKYEKKHLPKLFKRFQNDKSCVSDLLLLARCLRTFDIKKGKETFYRNT